MGYRRWEDRPGPDEGTFGPRLALARDNRVVAPPKMAEMDGSRNPPSAPESLDNSRGEAPRDGPIGPSLDLEVQTSDARDDSKRS
jgi:hypothetical protein